MSQSAVLDRVQEPPRSWEACQRNSNPLLTSPLPAGSVRHASHHTHHQNPHQHNHHQRRSSDAIPLSSTFEPLTASPSPASSSNSQDGIPLNPSLDAFRSPRTPPRAIMGRRSLQQLGSVNGRMETSSSPSSSSYCEFSALQAQAASVIGSGVIESPGEDSSGSGIVSCHGALSVFARRRRRAGGRREGLVDPRADYAAASFDASSGGGWYGVGGSARRALQVAPAPESSAQQLEHVPAVKAEGGRGQRADNGEESDDERDGGGGRRSARASGTNSAASRQARGAMDGAARQLGAQQPQGFSLPRPIPAGARLKPPRSTRSGRNYSSGEIALVGSASGELPQSPEGRTAQIGGSSDGLPIAQSLSESGSEVAIAGGSMHRSTSPSLWGQLETASKDLLLAAQQRRAQAEPLESPPPPGTAANGSHTRYVRQQPAHKAQHHHRVMSLSEMPNLLSPKSSPVTPKAPKSGPLVGSSSSCSADVIAGFASSSSSCIRSSNPSVSSSGGSGGSNGSSGKSGKSRKTLRSALKSGSKPSSSPPKMDRWSVRPYASNEPIESIESTAGKHIGGGAGAGGDGGVPPIDFLSSYFGDAPDAYVGEFKAASNVMGKKNAKNAKNAKQAKQGNTDARAMDAAAAVVADAAAEYEREYLEGEIPLQLLAPRAEAFPAAPKPAELLQAERRKAEAALQEMRRQKEQQAQAWAEEQQRLQLQLQLLRQQQKLQLLQAFHETNQQHLRPCDFVLGRPYSALHQRFVLSARELGSGQFGVIRKCVERGTNRVLACKTIPKANIVTLQDAADIRHEVAVMEALKGHPHVVGIEEVCEDEEAVNIVMELCAGGDLFDYVKDCGRLEERTAAIACKQLVHSLMWCHVAGVVHRDVKPENILLQGKLAGGSALEGNLGAAAAVLGGVLSPDSLGAAGAAAGAAGNTGGDIHIKLADFGVATFTRGKPCSEELGTLQYMAPEVLSGTYGPAADIWSAGVVLHIMLSGRTPFFASLGHTVQEAILQGPVRMRGVHWEGVSEEARSLVRAMLTKDAGERISAREILAHPWIVKHTT